MYIYIYYTDRDIYIYTYWPELGPTPSLAKTTAILDLVGIEVIGSKPPLVDDLLDYTVISVRYYDIL